MDSLIIYLIIGVVWIFQILAKKREVEIRQWPERKEPEPEREIIFEEPMMVEPQTEAEEIPQVVLPELPVETAQAEPGFSISDLSDDVFEQGIILSAVLGQPRSAVYLQQAYCQR